MSKRLEEILKRQEEIRSALDANTEGLISTRWKRKPAL